jgi:hypothetical protein
VPARRAPPAPRRERSRYGGSTVIQRLDNECLSEVLISGDRGSIVEEVASRRTLFCGEVLDEFKEISEKWE